MKVLHISSEKSWRGGEQQIAYLIDELTKAGVDNHVVCRAHSAFEIYCKRNNIPFVSLKFGFFHLIGSALQLKKIGESFDVIHAHTAKAHSLCYYALVTGMKTKVVVSRRVDFVPGTSTLTRKKYAHHGIKKIIGVSVAITKIMQGYVGESMADRCVTIHSGVDLDKVTASTSFDLKASLGVAESTIIIGNTSALADHKDYFTFLDSAKLLLQDRSDIKFVILGDGPMSTEIKAYAAQLGIQEQVFFMGFVSNPIDYLQHFDVFMITSKTEGLGTSIIDALANGVPVVATRAGGIPELVVHEQTGLLCDVGSASQLKTAVVAVLNDQSLRDHLISGGLTHVKSFSKEITARKTYAIYRAVVSDTGK